MKVKRWISILAAAVITTGVFAGCGQNQKSAENTDAEIKTEETSEKGTQEVHIGDQPSFFLLKIADNLGYFDDEFAGTGVKIVVDNFVNQGPAVVEAMVAEDLDLGLIGALPLVSADANNDHFVAISTVNYSENGFKLFAGKESGIQKVEDFKGKKLTVKFSTNEHQMLLTLLDQAGLNTSDVEIVNMNAAEGLAALTAGDVDGAVLKGNDVKTATDAGAYVVADNSTTGTISNYLVGRQEFVESHPEIVTGVLKALEKTRKWIDENKDETIQKYSELTGTDYDTAKVSFESRERSITIDADKFADTIQQSLDFSKEQKLIDNQDLTVDDIIDTSYYENSGVLE